MLQIGEFSTELATVQEIGARRRGVAERLDDDVRLTGRAFSAEAPDLVDALVKQHVEATIAPASFARHIARSGNHVDELQRHAGLALGADCEPPRRFDSQQHLSISRSADGGT